MDRQKLNDVFPNWLIGGGIFSALNIFDVPWQVSDIATELDIEYHGNISGEKFIAPLVNKLKVGDSLTSTEIEKLAGVIYNMYIDNWRREFDTLNMTYNPIENYNSVETMKDDITTFEHGRSHTRTDNLTHAKTGTETTTPNLTDRTTPNLTEITTPNLSNTDNNSVYAFNSSNAVPTATSSKSNTGTNTVTQSGTNTVTHTGSETLSHNTSDRDTGTVTDTDAGTDTNTHNYTMTRKGNIGVTTSQQMIQSERDLYMWNIFYKVVFPDIDRVLTLNIY